MAISSNSWNNRLDGETGEYPAFIRGACGIDLDGSSRPRVRRDDSTVSGSNASGTIWSRILHRGGVASVAGDSFNIDDQTLDAGLNQVNLARRQVVIPVVTSGGASGRVIESILDANTLFESYRLEAGDFRPNRMKETLYHKREDFDEEVAAVQFESGLRADEWVTAGTNYAAANVTYLAGSGGYLSMVTAGADDDSVTITGSVPIAINANPVLEARFRVTDITNVAIYAGFVEGSFADKGTYDDDIAVVGIDSDNAHTFGADQIILVTNDNNAGASVQDMGSAITAGTFITIRVDLTDTEQPRVWVNNAGTAILSSHEVAAASITGTVQAAINVYPYLHVQSLSGAADTMVVDYIEWWHDRV